MTATDVCADQDCPNRDYPLIEGETIDVYEAEGAKPSEEEAGAFERHQVGEVVMRIHKTCYNSHRSWWRQA